MTFKLGDSSLPQAPVEGGSFTAATVGSAVKAACERLRKKLFKLARKVEGSPLAGAKLNDVTFADGQIRLSDDPSRAVSITDAMRQASVNSIEARRSAGRRLKKQREVFALRALGGVRGGEGRRGLRHDRRHARRQRGRRRPHPEPEDSAQPGHRRGRLGHRHGPGRGERDRPAFGRFMNHNLAEYHVPVNADVHDIDVIFVEEHDAIVNPLGVKGLGEIGVVGVAAAIANAVFHATGKRVRDLPITLDKLL